MRVGPQYLNYLFTQKHTIRDGRSTALYTAYTIDTVYTVDNVDNVDMVYTVDMVVMTVYTVYIVYIIIGTPLGSSGNFPNHPGTFLDHPDSF